MLIQNKFDSYLLLKRIFDLILAIILFILHLPIFFIIYIFVVFETKQFPFFVQERAIALNGNSFKIIKFRTLRKADHSSNEIEIKKHVLNNSHLEPYVGRVGKFLRLTGLDELPQLINIINDDMSFVGPRPLSISDLEMIAKNHPTFSQERSKLNIKPGLSGLWQTNKDKALSVKHLVEMDKFYYDERSLLFDAYLMIKTLNVILFGRHKDAIITGSKTKLIEHHSLAFFEICYLITVFILLAIFY